MASVPLPRRSARNAAATDCLPDDVLAIVFGFLGADDLCARVARVCKRFRAVLNAEAHLWEAAMFELDPLGCLGPQRAAAAIVRGMTPLALAHSLGDPRCGRCRRRGGIKYCLPRLQRLCKTCYADDAGLKNAATPVLVTRFYFVPPSHPHAVHVSTEDELRAALDAFEPHAGNNDEYDDDASLHTIVLDCDIVLDDMVAVTVAVKLCGRGGESTMPKLLCYDNAALYCGAAGVVLEGISIETGRCMEDLAIDPDTGEIDYDALIEAFEAFPAVEVARIGEAIGLGFGAVFEGLSTLGLFAYAVVRNCGILGHNGASFVLDGEGSSVALHGCTLRTESAYALISRDVLGAPPPGCLPCTVSLRGCALRGAVETHLLVGGVTDADVAALRAGNTFSRIAVGDVGRHDTAPVVVQPWRAGALGAAMRGAIFDALPRSSSGGAGVGGESCCGAPQTAPRSTIVSAAGGGDDQQLPSLHAPAAAAAAAGGDGGSGGGSGKKKHKKKRKHTKKGGT